MNIHTYRPAYMGNGVLEVVLKEPEGFVVIGDGLKLLIGHEQRKRERAVLWCKCKVIPRVCT